MGYNPGYKWTNPTYPIYNQGYNPQKRSVGSSPPSTNYLIGLPLHFFQWIGSPLLPRAGGSPARMASRRGARRDAGVPGDRTAGFAKALQPQWVALEKSWDKTNKKL